ncbi:hypothetical protein [Beijerinckia sp. L45]|uniref:hypothetical protein n=1 Tax=Beijerinckia sp. L45 TaxID=1641855 RepID=UPI00131AFAD9|nr:hypothetical protein [Beijerinckia sp. L45]
MAENITALATLAFGLLAFAGWCQHLYTCFNEHLTGFLIAGALFFPVAVVHGWGIWMHWWS